MPDLPYIEQAQEVKITGQDSTGDTVNYVSADSVGNLAVRDASDAIDGDVAPTYTSQVGGKDVNGNIQALSTDTTGALFVTERLPLTGSSPSAASVGITSGVVIAANTSRRGLVLINTSINIVSFNIVGGAAVLRSGITLYPGGVWEMDAYTFTTAGINGIASAASSNVALQELI